MYKYHITVELTNVRIGPAWCKIVPTPCWSILHAIRPSQRQNHTKKHANFNFVCSSLISKVPTTSICLYQEEHGHRHGLAMSRLVCRRTFSMHRQANFLPSTETSFHYCDALHGVAGCISVLAEDVRTEWRPVRKASEVLQQRISPTNSE